MSFLSLSGCDEADRHPLSVCERADCQLFKGGLHLRQGVGPPAVSLRLPLILVNTGDGDVVEDTPAAEVGNEMSTTFQLRTNSERQSAHLISMGETLFPRF